MIAPVLNAIVGQLNTYIGLIDPEVVLGNISFVDAFQDTPVQSLSDRVIASVINIEQEGVLRNLPFRQSITGVNGLPQGVQRQPEVFLNVYILFGANKQNYEVALQRVAQVIAFFQRQYVYTPSNLPVLTGLNIEKVIFDLYSTNFEQLNHLWGVIGGKYIPSVIYKMRLAVIQDAVQQGTGIVSEVQINTSVNPSNLIPNHH
jgi:hypothetical protein